MANVIIVDDDEIVAELASEALIEAGHPCGWVTDGAALFELLRWRRPDVVLLDQDMPGLSGEAIMRQLRASDRFYDLPIIMFTHVLGVRDEERARYHGAQAYVRKPFDPHALVRQVERVLACRANRPSHTDLRAWLAAQNDKAGVPRLRGVRSLA